MLALLCLWEEELGGGRQRVAGHQHQLLKLQQLLDVLFNEARVTDGSEQRATMCDSEWWIGRRCHTKNVISRFWTY